jgi:DnaK suppressor protein
MNMLQNSGRLDHFKALLLARRAALLGDVRDLEKEEKASAGGEIGGSIHSADLVADRSAHDVSLGCLESVTHEIQAIDEALERIGEGTYGVCDGCGAAISEPRLEAIPYAQFCLNCQRNEEAS